MPDADFIEEGDAVCKEGKVFEAQVVAGVDTQADGAAVVGTDHEGGYGSGAVGDVGGSVGFGVEFDTVCSDGFCRIGLCALGGDEERDPDAFGVKLFNPSGEEVCMGEHVPSGIGGELVRRIRHQCDLGRAYGADEPGKFVGGIALDVEFGVELLGELVDIGMPDVALVRAWMHRDALCTETFAIEGHAEHIGVVSASSVAQGGDFVDIYAELNHNPVVVIWCYSQKAVLLREEVPPK